MQIKFKTDKLIHFIEIILKFLASTCHVHTLLHNIMVCAGMTYLLTATINFMFLKIMK